MVPTQERNENAIHGFTITRNSFYLWQHKKFTIWDNKVHNLRHFKRLILDVVCIQTWLHSEDADLLYNKLLLWKGRNGDALGIIHISAHYYGPQGESHSLKNPINKFVSEWIKYANILPSNIVFQHTYKKFPCILYQDTLKTWHWFSTCIILVFIFCVNWMYW